MLGGWTYALYTGSLLNYNRTHNGAFVIASGAILGLGAAFLWITQGAIMLSYPLPHQKGRSGSYQLGKDTKLSSRYRTLLGYLQSGWSHRLFHITWLEVSDWLTQR
jgi:hypothetical protein